MSSTLLKLTHPAYRYLLRRTVKANSNPFTRSCSFSIGRIHAIPNSSDADYHPFSAKALASDLDHLGLDRWGWVIYRTTYADDVAWERFKHIINHNSRTDLMAEGAHDLSAKLEWTFVDDKATLDGASRAELRQRFRRWVAGVVGQEQPRNRSPGDTHGVSRYHYFVQVDEESLRSVTGDRPTTTDPLTGRDGGTVIFVEAEWEPSTDDGELTAEDIEFGNQPIDGCRDDNVGWMHIASSMLNASWYVEMSYEPWWWDKIYVRPPDYKPF